jgi:hypothetical protein
VGGKSPGAASLRDAKAQAGRHRRDVDHADFALVRLAVRDASIRNPPSEFRLLLIFHAYL